MPFDPRAPGRRDRTAGLLGLVLVSAAVAQPSEVFSRSEIAQCGDIRIPQLTVTPSGVLMAAQCRSANASRPGSLGDDMVNCKVVTKFSADNGTSWGPMRVLTPERGHSHGQVVYDRLRKRVLLQYQYHPNTDPTLNSSLFQRVSSDDGASWSAEQQITNANARCNPRAPQNMQVGSAGSKIQTESGRIIFLGHANGVACRWWTDDGGVTYNASSPYVGNEASVAEVDPLAGTVYMNARGLTYPEWKGNRTSYFSRDDGASFSAPEACPIKEDAGFGCSAGMEADPYPPAGGAEMKSGAAIVGPRRLFLAEPAGPGRKGLVVHCSLDGGYTWPLSKAVGGAQEAAAYSALRMVKTGPHSHRLLVVWERKPNFQATLIETAWCS